MNVFNHYHHLHEHDKAVAYYRRIRGRWSHREFFDNFLHNFCRAMLCIARLLPACGVRLSVCLSVRPSVCHVRELRQNE